MPKRKPKKHEGPSGRPHRVRRRDAWFYETASHAEVYIAYEGGVTSVRIPWGQLFKASERCGQWDAKQELWIPRPSDV